MKNITIIQNLSQAPQSLLKQIYQLRHKVFCEDKKWIEPNKQKQELDSYDNRSSVYFAYIDASTDKVLGCFRLIPTTHPYMLKEIFPMLLGDCAPPESADIWEISRFAVTINERHNHVKSACVTSSLLLALFEYAMNQHIRAIVGVTDTAFEVLLRRSGLYSSRYAPPRKIGNCEAVAGYAEVTKANFNRLKERHARLLNQELSGSLHEKLNSITKATSLKESVGEIRHG